LRGHTCLTCRRKTCEIRVIGAYRLFTQLFLHSKRTAGNFAAPVATPPAESRSSRLGRTASRDKTMSRMLGFVGPPPPLPNPRRCLAELIRVFRAPHKWSVWFDSDPHQVLMLFGPRRRFIINSRYACIPPLARLIPTNISANSCSWHLRQRPIPCTLAGR
jgi:hypothetical protein